MQGSDDPDHIERVRRELLRVGVTKFGFWRFSVRSLHNLIHPEEHIKGAVYGRYREAEGQPPWEEGVLVATDRRVLFVDRKPGFLRADEISYNAVSGVEESIAWPFSAVTLYTGVGDFSLRFARRECVEKFVAYVNFRQLENRPDTSENEQQS